MEHKHPQVLFLGNGLNLAYGGVSWGNLLKEIATRDDLDLNELRGPMPLQAILVTQNQVKDVLVGYSRKLYGEVTNPEQEQTLQNYLSMGFDHILTTNFSYELEIAAQGSRSISDYKLKKMTRHTSSVKKAEPMYLQHTYHECVFKERINRIWHIHGEARKSGSIILGHYYYANLLFRMNKYLSERRNDYQVAQQVGKQPTINSWMDAFILGDVYVLGFGFDLSEFDLWWLLDRKSREKADTGKVYFYRPAIPGFDEKLELMRLLGVEYDDCGITLPNEPAKNASSAAWAEYKEQVNKAYKEFYPRAMDAIRHRKAQNDRGWEWL